MYYLRIYTIYKMLNSLSRYFTSKKILYLNPVGISSFDAPIHSFLSSYKQSDTMLHVCSLIPKGRPTHLANLALEGVVIKDILEVTRFAEKNHYDAMIIGCFGDPGLAQARVLATKIVITAPLESCCNLALSNANNFSILLGRYSWMGIIQPALERMHIEKKLKSVREICMDVLELAKDRKETEKRLIEQAKIAVHQDRAESLVLGCTLEFGFYENLQKEVGVLVIDPVLASFKYAEFLAECKKRFCWHVSSMETMKPPIEEELQLCGIFGEDVIGNIID